MPPSANGASSADDSMKAKLIARLKALPSEALGSITERALETGLDQIANLPELFDKWLGP